jgi:hypothetical protein
MLIRLCGEKNSDHAPEFSPRFLDLISVLWRPVVFPAKAHHYHAITAAELPGLISERAHNGTDDAEASAELRAELDQLLEKHGRFYIERMD